MVATPSHFSLQNLKRAFDSPHLVARELNRLYFTRLYSKPFNESGTDVFSEDWDNLVILDACRYDMLETASLNGKLEHRISRGSNTIEFLFGNFTDRSLRDTVYVTANAQLEKFYDKIRPELHEIINVWQEDGWDDEHNTVMPSTVTESAKDAAEEFPNKRLVVHYLQPHQPFVGETGREKFDTTKYSPWMEKVEGRRPITRDELRTAFMENFELVVPEVEQILNHLDGKTVVTSDHGQMIGERAKPIPISEYGHPQGIYTEELVKVPWLVVDGDERREIIAGESTHRADVDDTIVEDRLEDLGYK